MTVLIVESSIQIINRLESLVLEADNKLEIFKALTLTGALRMFETYKPGVVLLDMHFQHNKAEDLLKKIKKKEINTYIIALSIYGRVNIREHCMQLGADCCLDKYKEFDKIPGVIKAFCSAKNFK